MSPWGDACTGHIPSRRPSPSASTTGSNPPWRTWQIALATPALLQPGPAPHTRIPFNPNELPQGPGARREVGHWRWSRVSESVTSFLQLYISCFLSILCHLHFIVFFFLVLILVVIVPLLLLSTLWPQMTFIFPARVKVTGWREDCSEGYEWRAWG